VLFVIGLKHKLLSVSQICDKGNDVIFKKYSCEIRRKSNEKIVSYGIRISRNTYTLMENTEDSCLISPEDIS